LEQQFDEDQLFNIIALTLGANYRLFSRFGTNFSAGLQGSVYLADSLLDSIYGKNPFSAQVYLRIYPQIMKMGTPDEHQGMEMRP
jgi:hypothetical protein